MGLIAGIVLAAAGVVVLITVVNVLQLCLDLEAD